MIEKYEEAVKYFNTKRWGPALQAFQEIDASGFNEEKKLDYAYYLGLCYAKLERHSDAAVYLEQVIAGSSDSLRICQCKITLAYIYIATRHYKLAEAELDSLLVSGFQSAQIYTMMGYSALLQKQRDKARGFYEKALDIEAGNPTAMNGLGFILADTGEDAKRGVELCKKAVEKSPSNPAYLDSLGWAYYKTGKMKEAKTCLRRAMEFAPRHKEISKHMKIVVGNGA